MLRHVRGRLALGACVPHNPGHSRLAPGEAARCAHSIWGFLPGRCVHLLAYLFTAVISISMDPWNSIVYSLSLNPPALATGDPLGFILFCLHKASLGFKTFRSFWKSNCPQLLNISHWKLPLQPSFLFFLSFPSIPFLPSFFPFCFLRQYHSVLADGLELTM